MAAGARVVVQTRDALLAQKEILAISDGNMRRINQKEVKSTRSLY
jgi:hypothetical protein